MKVWILAVILTLVPVSTAFAAEVGDDTACQADTTRQDLRVDTQQTQQAAPPVAPAPATHPVATVQRDASAAAPVHADASRRRSGKPVPDSELIAPRGAL
ncbi:MAG: hypothetical protein QM759_05165 [Terricaulis sp.]